MSASFICPRRNSFCTAPSFITSSRSHMPISSAISSLMITIALPSLRIPLHLRNQLVHALFHADIHAAGGAVQDQDLASRAQPLSEYHLLLVAAAHGAHRLFHMAALDAQGVDLLLHISRFALLQDQLSFPDMPEAPDRDIVPDGSLLAEGFGIPLLGYIADSEPRRLFRIAEGFSFCFHGSAGQHRAAEQRLPQRMHAAFAESPDSEDFTGPDLQGNVLQAASVQAVRLQQHRFLPGGFIVRPVIVALHFPADHAGFDGVIVIGFPGEVGDNPAVPQHGQRIADLLDLVQVMGDENHRPAFLFQAVHQPVQQLAAFLGKRGRGFVHHQDFRLLHHNPGHFHQLAFLQVQHSGRHARIDMVGMDHVERFPAFRFHGPAAYQPQPVPESSAFPQEQVFRHGNTRNCAGFLHDHADSVLQGVDHGGWLPGLSVEFHLPGIRLLDPRDNGGQRGLSAPVLPDQPADFTGIYVQVHLSQRNSRAEALVHSANG